MAAITTTLAVIGAAAASATAGYTIASGIKAEKRAKKQQAIQNQYIEEQREAIKEQQAFERQRQEQFDKQLLEKRSVDVPVRQKPVTEEQKKAEIKRQSPEQVRKRRLRGRRSLVAQDFTFGTEEEQLGKRGIKLG